MRTTGDVNQGRFDAIVAALDDITDAERVEAELRAVRAEAEARVAVANADAERQRVETAAARVLAEESNAASISATGALGVSTVQVETLTLRVTDAEATEAELRTQLGERGGQIEALQAAGEAAAKSLAELTATAGSGVSRETSTVSRLFASKARSTTLARRSLPPNGSGRPRRGAPSGTGRLGSGLNVSQPSLTPGSRLQRRSVPLTKTAYGEPMRPATARRPELTPPSG